MRMCRSEPLDLSLVGASELRGLTNWGLIRRIPPESLCIGCEEDQMHQYASYIKPTALKPTHLSPRLQTACVYRAHVAD